VPTQTQTSSGDSSSSPREPRFSRERVLGPDGPKICGQPHHVIVGALHDDDTKDFTRAGLASKVERFLKREVEQPEPTDAKDRRDDDQED
jgi:hypothetical protein